MTANMKLQSVSESKKIRGFSNLLWKENRGWWRTHRWWINLLIWTGMLGSLIFLMAFVVPVIAATVDDPNVAAAGSPEAFGLEMGKNVFFELGTMALAIGAVVLSLDVVVQEKQTGVAEWLLAKPVARRSYILAKLGASGVAILILLIGIPSIVAYVMLSLRNETALPLLPFLAGIGMMVAHTMFYLCLTLMLGAFFNSRPPILGIAFASIMGGSMIAGMLKPLTMVTPWMLGKLANMVNGEISIPLTAVLAPVAATLVWCAVFVLAAIWKMERTEF